MVNIILGSTPEGPRDSVEEEEGLRGLEDWGVLGGEVGDTY